MFALLLGTNHDSHLWGREGGPVINNDRSPSQIPFNPRHKLSREAVFSPEFFTDLSLEQQFFVNQVHANNADKFTKVHSRNHLLKSEKEGKIAQISNMEHNGWGGGGEGGEGILGSVFAGFMPQVS